MPNLKTYDLFISHAWKYNEDYYRLVNLLNAALYFKWRNYSDPEHSPVVDPNTPIGKRRMLEELDQQIRPVNCVLIISGMYVYHSQWIQEEIDIAASYSKPIVGIRPWGQERIPIAVTNAAKIIVGWNTDSIVQAVRDYAI